MKRLDEDLIGGGLLVAVGLFCALYAQSYEVGTLGQMGPGFFPVALGIILAVLGVFILVPGLRRTGSLPKLEWRNGACILGSFLVFAFALPSLGLIAASLLTVIISSLADRETTWLLRLVLATAITLLTVLIFKIGLGMPVSLW